MKWISFIIEIAACIISFGICTAVIRAQFRPKDELYGGSILCLESHLQQLLILKWVESDCVIYWNGNMYFFCLEIF